ncbi:hypothetical protein IRT45_05795 [Nocardia sp. BSTN01]|uniref:hypothetical protein n=1 Tax=Nocardia sp. BSTN01 TaxID=2783665 RepID=UPI00188E8D60|nr:hypothetical protein [Nocardia sp. BSTN01]MBF4996667.1 hypothetical protein [Nocardia sp. BSTN01]
MTRPKPQGAEPWRNPGNLIFIPGDDSLVAPLPPGTKVGNVREMADGFESIHASFGELAEDPKKMGQFVNDLMTSWAPDRWDKETRALIAKAEADEASEHNAGDGGDPQPAEQEGGGVPAAPAAEQSAPRSQEGTSRSNSTEVGLSERLRRRVRNLGRGALPA